MTGTASSVSCPRGIQFKWFKCNNNSLYFYLQYIYLFLPINNLLSFYLQYISLSPYINNLLSVSTSFLSLFRVLFRFGMGRILLHVLSFNPVCNYSTVWNLCICMYLQTVLQVLSNIFFFLRIGQSRVSLVLDSPILNFYSLKPLIILHLYTVQQRLLISTDR